MEVRALKYGDLMGSPDIKDVLAAAGPGSERAHAAWEAMAALKLAFGWSGQATCLLLVEPLHPEAFPALVDPSWVSPDPATHGPEAVERVLARIAELGVVPTAIRTVLLTHEHMDHWDPRLAERLPGASVVRPGEALDPAHSGGLIEALDTPGHGGPHTSYLLDLPDRDLSLAIAGDLVMSHAHALDLDHPLAFSDADAGRASLARVVEALDARPGRWSMIAPGHDRPFLVTDGLRRRVGLPPRDAGRV